MGQKQRKIQEEWKFATKFGYSDLENSIFTVWHFKIQTQGGTITEKNQKE